MKLRSVFIAALLSLVVTVPAFAYEAFKGTLGLLQNNPEKTYKGYTIVTPLLTPTTYMIDMEGNLIHQWKGTMPAFYAELLPNGNLLRHVRFPDAQQPVSFGGESGKLEEVDWNGNIVWEHTMFSDKEVSHHAFDRMPNGNTMVLGWEYKSYEDLKAKGRKDGVGGVTEKPFVYKGGLSNAEKAMPGIWPDFIREINPKGETVWEYHVWDNLGTGPDQFDVNFIGVPGDPMFSGPDWTHWNAVRYNPKTNQVLVDSRNWGEVYVIDYATKKMVYRWGNPGAYGKGKLPPGYNQDGEQKLFGPHDATWLENGNIGVFDNGTNRPSGSYSRVVELDPKENKVVWFFTAPNAPIVPNSFYSSFQSAAQKLANGNWLVTSTWHGHVFEVTPQKEVVWEWNNPMAPNGLFCSTIATLPMMVHRAFRYAPDYAGLQGKDLTPKGKMLPDCPEWDKLLNVKLWTPPVPAAAPAAPAPAAK